MLNKLTYKILSKEVEKGKTDAQIAEIYNMKRRTVCALREKYGIKRKLAKDLLSYDTMLKEVNAGKTDSQIAEEYGLTVSNVQLIRNNDYNISKSQITIEQLIPYELMLEKFEKGESDAKIAKDYNVSRICICQLRNKYGIKKRHAFSEVSYDKLKNDYSEKSDREIAKDFGCSTNAICKLREKYNIDSKVELSENKISKEDMLFYTTQDKTDIEIAQIYGFSVETIGNLRRKYKIRTKFSNTTSTENDKLLTKLHKEIIFGTILGDGYVIKEGILGIGHCPEQYSYICWLNKLLKPLSFDVYYDKKCNSFRIYTRRLDFLKNLRKVIYPRGKKIVPDYVLDNLTPLSLAIWFMDDGSRCGSGTILCTHGFSHRDRKKITNYFKEKWGIESKIRRTYKKEREKFYYYHSFNADNSYKFYKIIENHILPEMLYKTRREPNKLKNRNVKIEM